MSWKTRLKTRTLRGRRCRRWPGRKERRRASEHLRQIVSAVPHFVATPARFQFADNTTQPSVPARYRTRNGLLDSRCEHGAGVTSRHGPGRLVVNSQLRHVAFQIMGRLLPPRQTTASYPPSAPVALHCRRRRRGWRGKLPGPPVTAATADQLGHDAADCYGYHLTDGGGVWPGISQYLLPSQLCWSFGRTHRDCPTRHIGLRARPPDHEQSELSALSTPPIPWPR